MPTVTKARHVGFVASGANRGKPLFRELELTVCVDTPLVADGHGGDRLVGFVAGGSNHATPLFARALTCCDHVDDCDRVEAFDWMPQGITQTILLKAFEIANCAGAKGEEAVLTYCGPTAGGSAPCEWDACATPAPDPVDGCEDCDPAVTTRGKWLGSMALRGGTLNFELCITDLGDPDAFPEPLPPTFQLVYRGCAEGCVQVGATINCLDPLVLNFGNLTLPDCCGCDDALTDEAAEVLLVAHANCYPVVLARHVGFDAGGEPVFAADDCGGDAAQGCCTPTCPLVAEIANVTGCACLADTVDLERLSGSWTNLAAGACSANAILELSCEANVDEDDELDGTATLTLVVTCGADNTGSDTVVIDCDDLESLDVTFTVDMLDPSAGPGDCDELDCEWTWNDMAAGWELTDDPCDEECDDCANTPANPPADPVDQQVHTEPCTGGAVPPDCCVGTITVRVTRP